MISLRQSESKMAALHRVILFSAFLFCYAQAASLTVRATNPDVLIQTSTDAFSPGLTKDLSVSCTVPDPVSAGYLQLVSLVLTKRDAVTQITEDVASVNTFQPGVVNVYGNSTATVTGAIVNSGSSYLTADWHYPARSDAGYYECEATVLNSAGHPVILKSGAEVRSEDPTMDRLMEMIRLVELQFEELNNRVDLATGSLFKSSGVIDGSRYYVSQYAVDDVNRAQAACQLVGASLVEINNQAEYDQVVQMLNNGQYLETPPKYVFIGMNDKVNEGNWVYWQSGTPVEFFNWHTTEPDTPTNDCAGLYVGYNYEYIDLTCDDRANPSYFVCERKEAV